MFSAFELWFLLLSRVCIVSKRTKRTHFTSRHRHVYMCLCAHHSKDILRAYTQMWKIYAALLHLIQKKLDRERVFSTKWKNAFQNEQIEKYIFAPFVCTGLSSTNFFIKWSWWIIHLYDCSTEAEKIRSSNMKKIKQSKREKRAEKNNFIQNAHIKYISYWNLQNNTLKDDEKISRPNLYDFTWHFI